MNVFNEAMDNECSLKVFSNAIIGCKKKLFPPIYLRKKKCKKNRHIKKCRGVLGLQSVILGRTVRC